MLELLAFVFGEILLVGIFYWPGWVVLRILTLGRYPRRRSLDDAGFVACCGGVATLIVLVVIFS